MLRNYLKITFRNIAGNKTYTAINVAGLATGMCVCFFALLYVRFELSYDTYHKKADLIYRLVTDVRTASGVEYKSTVGAMARTIQDALPEVQQSTRIFPDYLIVKKDNDVFGEEKIAYADSSIFSVFTLPLVSGNPATVFNAAYNIVLSETAAKRYFGKTDAVGQKLLLNGNDPAYVTGVMKDMPVNSHFRTDILVSMKTLGSEWEDNWKRFFFYSYLVLPENADIPALNAKITKLVKDHTDQSKSQYSLFLEPLKRVYLEGNPRGSRGGTSVAGSWTNVYIFSIVALLVLFIACFNFVNLTTAYSIRRMKEIGVRKVLGGKRKQLIFQFLTDAVTISAIAAFFGILLVIILLPAFNSIIGKKIIADNVQLMGMLSLLLPGALVLGLLAGAYPAFFLSGTSPVQNLKGKIGTAGTGLTLRKSLVVAQFCVSVVLITATMVVYRQLDFMKNHEPGFKKDHRLVIDYQFDGRVSNQPERFKQQFGHVTSGGKISMSSCFPGKVNHTFPTKIENKDSDLQEFQADAYFIDHDFLNQFGIEMAAGRPFKMNLSSDSTEAMIINEAACKALGFANAEQALGKRFQQLSRQGVIVGVTRDFHFQSFQEKVKPLTFRIAPGFFTYLTLDVPSMNLSSTVDKLKGQWQKLVPDMPFIYSFADEAYHAQYEAEERFGALFVCMAALAIILSCLGLMGLSALSITQRTKEIGVRKVLGASVAAVFGLLTKDFLLLVLTALIIGTPLAWYVMNKWLQTFAYRIEVRAWILISAGAMVVLVALLTVSIQSIKAALMNPVKSLKSD
ncbi:ABC transporter permease [Dyadobacter sp. 32]|uniref:ABC transporter permease n=1 Tax=Dyadobacter sp. 32 TaxID=538966 RepID=UPI0011EE2AE7